MHACVRVSAFAPSQRRQQQQNNNTPNQQQQHPIRSDPIVVVCYCVCFWKRFQTIDSKMASSGAAEKEKFHNGSFKAYPHSELNNSTDDVRLSSVSFWFALLCFASLIEIYFFPHRMILLRSFFFLRE